MGGETMLEQASGSFLTSTFRADERSILEDLARGVDIASVLTSTVQLIERQGEGMRCSVLMLDAKRGVLHSGVAPSLPEEYMRAIDGSAIGPAEGSCGAAAALGEV